MTILHYSLALSALLFAVGVAGVIVRRNAIILFMCVELMLNAANLAFVALSPFAGIQGQIVVFFVIAVAAGLVQSEARGRHVCYRADFAAMNGLIEFLTRNCCGGDTAQCAPAAPCGPEGCA